MDTRAKLAKLLRKPDVPDDVWGLLEEAGDVLDAELHHDYESLAISARRVIKYFPASGTWRPDAERDGGDASYEPTSWRREDYERAEALREYLSYEGDKLRAVRDFRQGVLDGRSLDSSDLWQFLTSPAILMFPIGDLKSAGVDPVNHTSEVEDEPASRGSYRATVRITPVQKLLRLTEGGALYEEHAPTESQSLNFRAARKDSAIRFEERFEAFPPTVWPEPGESNSRGDWMKSRYWPGSVFADLIAVAGTLSRRFAWEVTDAFRFVLTGDAPQILPIETHVTRNRGAPNSRINLSVSSWVSSETLAKHFQAVKRRRGAARQRSVSSRNLRIFRSVTRWRAEDEDATWEAMMERWNASRQEDVYLDRRMFHRDYERAAGAIMRERFGFDLADTGEAIAALRRRLAPTYGEKNERIAKGKSDE